MPRVLQYDRTHHTGQRGHHMNIPAPTLLEGGSSSNLIYSVLPKLPEGLILDKVSGAISGSPTEFGSELRRRTITARNSIGATSTVIKMRTKWPPAVGIFHVDINFQTVQLGKSMLPVHPSISTWYGPCKFFIARDLLDNLPYLSDIDLSHDGVISGTFTEASGIGEPIDVHIFALNEDYGTDFNFNLLVLRETYIPSSQTIDKNTDIVPAKPANRGIYFDGPESNFRALTPLPAGLQLDQFTGTISGRPTSSLLTDIECCIEETGEKFDSEDPTDKGKRIHSLLYVTFKAKTQSSRRF